MGKLEKMKIWHDNTGLSPGWFLIRVIINDWEYKYTFYCGRWLSKDEDDRLIERTLDVQV